MHTFDVADGQMAVRSPILVIMQKENLQRLQQVAVLLNNQVAILIVHHREPFFVSLKFFVANSFYHFIF